MATFVMKDAGRSLELGVKAGTAAVSKSPKASLSTISIVIKLYHTGERIYFGKLV